MASGEPRVQWVWWGWRYCLEAPLFGTWRYGPASRPDWWMFRAILIGPVEVRVWRRDEPWKVEVQHGE
jgi:hypothetical protein